jgi:hypothetical protein
MFFLLIYIVNDHYLILLKATAPFIKLAKYHSTVLQRWYNREFFVFTKLYQFCKFKVANFHL